MGEAFALATPVRWFYGWAPELGLPTHELRNFTALEGRLLQRRWRARLWKSR